MTIKTLSQDLPNKKYDVIYADPPWSYDNKSVAFKKRGKSYYSIHKLEEHYNTLTFEEIKNLPIEKISKTNSVCFLWITNPLLPDCLDVLKNWGFKYKTMLTWRKILSHGMGYWFKGQTEHLLLGVKGNVKAFKCREPNFVQASVLHKKHSQKPEKFRTLIERATSKIPNCERIELFARTKVHGWDSWGDELQISTPLEVYMK